MIYLIVHWFLSDEYLQLDVGSGLGPTIHMKLLPAWQRWKQHVVERINALRAKQFSLDSSVLFLVFPMSNLLSHRLKLITRDEREVFYLLSMCPRDLPKMLLGPTLSGQYVQPW